MSNKRLLVVLLVLANFSYVPLKAQSTNENLTGVHQHDGFYLRFHAGFGPGKMIEENVLGSDLTLEGVASIFRFQIGGTISRNLILFGEFGGFTVVDPKLEWQGVVGTISKTYFAITDVGIGLSYYFMPANIYMSSTIAFSSNEIEVDDANINRRSDTGLGLYLSVGKEWWVGSQWGLGVAICGHFSHTKDTIFNQEYPINNAVLGLVFSATFQ